ncbi:MAG: phenazine biosynthesis protein PhzF [Candidatus Saccharibacteria bacterium]|nr:phenazine biosynthesis protein PhzF [Candidatus Saccharibacteria bacterium]
MRVSLVQVNAFTANSTGGNPAGVVLGADSLTDSQMLGIAKQVAFSETAFITSNSSATKNVRFFTPTEEVDLCGHATIGSWSYMFRKGLIQSGRHTQNTKAGLLKVEIRDGGRVYMEQTNAGFFDEINSAEVAAILRIGTSDLRPDLKPQIVSTGLRDLLVPVASEDVLNSINPDFDAMTEMSKRYGIVGFHVFALLPNQLSVAVARNFAPLFGIDEESATGTSNGALFCYLREHKELPPSQAEYRIEQGKTMNQLSYIYGNFKNDIVWIGGTASVVKEFELSI